MSTSVGVETLTETRPRGVDLFDPVDVFFMVFHRINAVEGKGREQRGTGYGLAHGGHGRGDLIAQQMTAQTGFGPLGVFEFDHGHPFDGVFPDPEQTGGHLGDDVVLMGDQGLGEAALAGAAETAPGGIGPDPGQHGVDADGTKGHAPAVNRDADILSRAAVLAAV